MPSKAFPYILYKTPSFSIVYSVLIRYSKHWEKGIWTPNPHSEPVNGLINWTNSAETTKQFLCSNFVSTSGMAELCSEEQVRAQVPEQAVLCWEHSQLCPHLMGMMFENSSRNLMICRYQRPAKCWRATMTRDTTTRAPNRILVRQFTSKSKRPI